MRQKNKGSTFVEILITLIIFSFALFPLLHLQLKMMQQSKQLLQETIKSITKHNHQEKGFTLIEVLIALVLGVFFSLVLVQTFSIVHQQNIVQHQWLMRQSNLSLMEHLLRHTLDDVGWLGCQKFNPVIVFNQHQITFEKSFLLAHVIEFTHPLELKLDQPIHIHQKTKWMIADCIHAEKIEVAEIKKDRIILSQYLKHHYQYPVFIIEMKKMQFDFHDQQLDLIIEDHRENLLKEIDDWRIVRKGAYLIFRSKKMEIVLWLRNLP